MFLTETDTNLKNEEELVFEGYKTVFPAKTSEEEKIWIIWSDINPKVEVKTALMSDGFASIWLEVKANHIKVYVTLLYVILIGAWNAPVCIHDTLFTAYF